MGSVLSWAANTVLFVAGCFLAADTANEVIASLLTPVTTAAVEPRAPAPPRDRTWSNRQVILSRNLFNSSTLDPPPPPEDLAEDIEKSQLPLTLLGTFASPDPLIARAALQEKGKPETLVVRVGEELVNGRATVIRIERRRVVLSENGALRELTLDEENGPPQPSRPVRTARAPRRPRARPNIPDLEKLGANRFSVDPDELKDAITNPANLLTQARIVPKFDRGQMVGLQVSGIKPGSLFEEMGVEEGDVIVELNGIPVNSPKDGLQLLQQFNSSQFDIELEDADGNPKDSIRIESGQAGRGS